MKTTITLTTAAPTLKICDLVRRRDAPFFIGTLIAKGTFGSGTVTFQLSDDQGTTLITAKDYTGNAMTATANAVFTTQPLGDSTNNFPTAMLTLWATISGSTGATVTIDLFDNR